MSTGIDTEAVKEAYDDVRNDASDTNWLVLKYEGNGIICEGSGEDYEEFKQKFTDDDRAFGFVRIFTGDEMSKRAKFALITWCGKNVSPLKRAKMSTDKSEVKKIVQSLAIEVQTDEADELNEDYLRGEIVKAGGANYGTGSR